MLHFTRQDKPLFMRYFSIVIFTAVFFFLSAAAGLGQDEKPDDDTVCQTFEDDGVEPDLIAHMRDAASKGMLYRIQPEHSKISFEIDSPIGIVHADFKDFQGGFTLETSWTGTEGKALLSAKTSSIDTSSGFISTLLKSETFLDTRQYPELLFVSKDFFWVNDNEAILVGDLSLHGTTQRIGLHVHLLDNTEADSVDAGQRILVEASAKINRSAFGINGLSSYVSDNVTLYMRILASRYQPGIDTAQLEQ